MADLAIENITSKIRPLSSNWLITFKDPRDLWAEHWFGLTFEIVCAVLLFQVFRHARKQGSEFFYLVLAAMTSTLCFELLPFLRDTYELYWYHPGIANFWSQRVPSFVISLFAIIHYLADGITRKSNLPCVSRSLVTAVTGTLIISPFLWMAPRLLFLTFHFDDPVFQDKIFDIPYIQLLVIFLLFFHTSHLYKENYEDLQPQERHTFNYVWYALQSGLVAAIYAIVEQYVLYLFLKLTLKINTGFCLLVAFAVLTWLAKGEIESLKITSISTAGVLQPLKRKGFWAIAAGFIFITTLPLWLNMANLKSTNDRLELGPCHITHLISNTSPLYVTRRQFLCPEDTKNLTYDFHCMQHSEVSSGVQKNAKSYTICGKNMTGHLQTVQKMAIYSSFCLFTFYNLMRLSFAFKFQQKAAAACKKVD